MADNYTARCPECGEVIEIDFYSEIGDNVTCYNCDAELEIIDVHPPRLKVLKKQIDKEDDSLENFDEDNFYNNEENYS